MAEEDSGHLGRIFRSIIVGGRPDSGFVDSELAQKEANELYNVKLFFKVNQNLCVFQLFFYLGWSRESWN